MLICGLMKTSLLDYPGKICCTVFTGGCNFRCPFCHNSSLLKGPFEECLSEEELTEFLMSRRGKLDGVCITGGEPLLQQDIKDFIISVKRLGFLVKLDTNGYYPERLKELIDSGLLDYIAMDIKNSFEKYSETAGIEHIDISRIKESIYIIKNSGIGYEFRTTVVKELHEPEDMEKIGKAIAGAERFCIQKFRINESNLVKTGLEPPEDEFLNQAQTILKNYIDTVIIKA